MSATAREPSFIDPRCLFSRKGLIAASGISDTRRREARRKYGLEIPWIECGRRKFARGSDIIAFIEQLAACEAAEAKAVS
jgi:hypothetical protein